jgi:hypothetical protein
VTLESSHDDRWQGHGPVRFARLHIYEDAFLPGRLQGMANAEPCGGQVYICPLKAEHFAQTQAEGDAARNDRFESMAGEGVEQGARLMPTECWRLAPGALGSAHECRDVPSDHLLAHYLC